MATAERRPARLATLLLPALALAAGALLLALHERPRLPLYRTSAFHLLFARDEPAGAALLLVLTALGAALVPLAVAHGGGVVGSLARRRRLVAAVAAAVLAAGALVVYTGRPLAMDEYAPWFQARVFAHGQLAARLPPELLPRLLPPRLLFPFFAMDAASGRVASAYWPGFALLLTPFAAVRAEWLLDPLLAAACLLLLARLARRWCGTPVAAGWALLLALASAAFTVDAISLYPLTAHLACNLLWMELLTEGSAEDGDGVRLTAAPRRLLAAGLVGSLALVLHNPVPHAAFALPWLVALLRRRGWRPTLLLAIGYAPLALLLGVGWFVGIRQPLGAAAAAARAAALAAAGGAPETPAAHGLLATLGGLFGGAFQPPTAAMLQARLLGLAELVTWAAPFLPVLAVAGGRAAPARSPLRLLAASAATTLLVYTFVPFDQGHGWGFRYFHAAWAALPLLAAAALVAPGAERWRAAALAAALLALPASSALRAWQVGSFIREHRAQLPRVPSTGRHVVFLDIAHGSYRVDLLQNDPYLRDRVLVLASEGEARDAALAAHAFPGARPLVAYPSGTVWRLPPAR